DLARRISVPAEFLCETAKPDEKILIHQIDELRFVFWVDLKSRRPLHIRTVTIGNRQNVQRGEMIADWNWRADERVRIKSRSIRERNEHFAKYFSVRLSQNPDTSNTRWIAAIFNRA